MKRRTRVIQIKWNQIFGAEEIGELSSPIHVTRKVALCRVLQVVN